MGPPDPEQRFEAVYMAHYAAMLSYVRRRTDSPDDAADAIAETFATAWRRVADIPDGDEARLWLYGVARRVLANHRRGESRRTALATRLRAELSTWAEDVPETSQPEPVPTAAPRGRLPAATAVEIDRTVGRDGDVQLASHRLRLTIIVDTWVSGYYGDHPCRPPIRRWTVRPSGAWRSSATSRRSLAASR
ncbi:RNA polymerase sigma factor [Actinoallomurus sp. CA-150999]|uniref:RNA polymerase sigma factor n=1 Tax=Actinoallomurus sp. CA-150999 TaxID=3239887 RepID=UPI003D8B27EF